MLSFQLDINHLQRPFHGIILSTLNKLNTTERHFSCNNVRRAIIFLSQVSELNDGESPATVRTCLDLDVSGQVSNTRAHVHRTKGTDYCWCKVTEMVEFQCRGESYSVHVDVGDSDLLKLCS